MSVANGLRLRLDSAPPLIDKNDFEDSDCYGFFGDFGKNTGRRQLEIREGAKYEERVIDI